MWSWDISYVPSSWVIRAAFLSLYDRRYLYSRKIVAAEVFSERIWSSMRQNCFNVPYGMKNVHPAISCFILIMESQCAAVRYWTKCTRLSIKFLFRPRLAMITLIPNRSSGRLSIVHGGQRMVFGTIDEARSWLSRFTRWYNRNTSNKAVLGVCYPDERHRGIDAQNTGSQKKQFIAEHTNVILSAGANSYVTGNSFRQFI